MGEIITVQKLGTGKEIVLPDGRTIEDPFRPNTEADWWEKISETETTLTIRIKP